MFLCTFHFRFSKDSVFFRGTGGVEKKDYEVTIPLYREIDPDKSKSFNRERCIEMVLAKAKPDEPYWPALTSDKKKHHWLKCDFNKWQDEDDSGDEGLGGMGGGDFEEMMRQMGGLGEFFLLISIIVRCSVLPKGGNITTLIGANEEGAVKRL